MELLVDLVIGSVIEWAILMIVIPIAQRLADFSMPGAVEMAWKLAAIVLLKNIVGSGLGSAVGGFGGGLAAIAVFWGGLYKVFDLDIFGAVIILVASWIVNTYVATALMAAFA